LGLAAAGDAVQQQRRRRAAGLAGGGGGFELLQRCGLLVTQRRQRWRQLGGGRAGRGGLVHLGDAVGQLGVVQLAQFWRQHGQRDFAGAALVVRGGEVHQR